MSRSYHSVLVHLKAATPWLFPGTKPEGGAIRKQLQVQAKLDNELSRRASKRMVKLLANDPEAQLLLKELSLVKSSLAGNEARREVPQSREFYWSRIQGVIAREMEEARSEHVLRFDWVWRLVPACSLLLGICAVLILSRKNEAATLWSPSEVEVVSAEMGAVTYLDCQTGLTVVWHYDRNQAVPNLSSAEVEKDIDPAFQ